MNDNEAVDKLAGRGFNREEVKQVVKSLLPDDGLAIDDGQHQARVYRDLNNDMKVE